MREASVERILVDGIRKAGGRALKFVSPSCAGVPDRIVLLPGGRVIFVELKQNVGRLSMMQIVMQARLRKLGMDVRTLYGAADVRDFLKEVMSDAFQAISVSAGSDQLDPGA